MVCFAMFPDCLAAIDLGRERVRYGVRPAVTVLSRLDQFLLGQLEPCVAPSAASVSGLWASLAAARSPVASRGLPAIPQWTLRMLVPRFERRVVGVDLVVVLLVVLIVLALVGSIAVSPLLWALVVILVLFAVLGRGRYYGRRG